MSYTESRARYAEVLDAVAQSPEGEAPLVEASVKDKVHALTRRFPIYAG